MNKKGFTMVELLAVIVVLGIIASIAVVSMSGIRNQIDIKVIQGNLDAALEAARTQGEKDLPKLESNPILIKVKKLKTITDLDIDKSYNNIEFKVFLAKNRAYACINNEDALVSIVGEDNRDKFNSYYCSSVTIPTTSPDVPETSYAKFDTGSNISKILYLIGKKIYILRNTFVKNISWCDSYCNGVSPQNMNMNFGEDSNFIDLIVKDDKLVHSCDQNGNNCSEEISGGKLYRIDISSPDSMHRIYLMVIGISLFYYSDVGYNNLYLNEDASYMFYTDNYLGSLHYEGRIEYVEYMDVWNTSLTTNMERMFNNSLGFRVLDLSKWDTSKVTNVSYMFYNMDNLKTLDISGWDLSNVNNSYRMLIRSDALTKITTPSKIKSGISIELPYTFYNNGIVYTALDSSTPGGIIIESSK